MRKFQSAFAFAVAVVCVCGAAAAVAEVPTVIGYQGRLTDAGGAPLDGDFNITFTIYDAFEIGGVEWQEQHLDTEGNAVTVVDGLFSVSLGAITPIPASTFDQPDRWLGITIGSDPELFPRAKLSSVGYAYKALSAEYAVAGGGWVDDGSVIRLALPDDSVGIGTSTPSSKLDVRLHTSEEFSTTTGISAEASGDGLAAEVVAVSGTASGGGSEIGTLKGVSGEAIGNATAHWEVIGTSGNADIVNGEAESVIGVSGTGNSTGGVGLYVIGVRGEANNTTGAYSYGLEGQTNATGDGVEGAGVYTRAFVDGDNSWAFGAKCEGNADGANASAVGLWGRGGGSAPNKYGVFGSAIAAGGTKYGIKGLASNAGDVNYGVFGEARDGTTNYGGYFIGDVVATYRLGIGEDFPTARLHIGGTPGVDGIRFPDGTLQTTAAAGGGGWSDDGDVVRLETATDSVGIGLSNPSEKLDVDGNIHASGIMDVGGIKMALGAVDGRVLMTNGSGDASWQDAPDWSWWERTGNVIETKNRLGILRKGNTAYGIHDSTHVNLGVGSYTGTSGQDHKYATVSGGYSGVAAAGNSTVAGGFANKANGASSTVTGGYQNKAEGNFSFVGGGSTNYAGFQWATVVGGQSDSATGSHSYVGGGIGNKASVAEATVSGGFRNLASGYGSVVGGGYENEASGDSSVVAGGATNTAEGDGSCIGGGYGNSADSGYATVGGGWQCVARGEKSTVGGGDGNRAYGHHSTIAGGSSNNTTHNWTFIGGGSGNSSDFQWATVGGGQDNTANGSHSFIGGGFNNTASYPRSVVSGGRSNLANAISSVVSGGAYNTARGDYAVVAGGGGATDADSNVAGREYAAIGGGRRNRILGIAGVIAGGDSNYVASSSYCTIAGGTKNQTGTNGGQATVGGGERNSASGSYSVVGGGHYNEAAGFGSAVPGGSSNYAGAYNSFAVGNRAKANHDGTFVWGDNSNADIASVTSNQFVVRASGGIWLGTTSSPTSTAGRFIETSTGGYLSTGGTWVNFSDRDGKENFAPIDGAQLLKQVSQLEITEWNYKTESDDVRHIGPMAQDFYAVFKVGNDDRSIATLDESGIALAAIQELHRKTQELEKKAARIDALEATVAELVSQMQMIMAEQNNTNSGSPDLSCR